MFEKNIEEAQSQYGTGGGDFFKFQKGNNKVRLLAGGKAVATHYLQDKKNITCFGIQQGCPYHGENAPKDKDGKPVKVRAKFAFYLLDRKEKEPRIQLAYLPYTIIKTLTAYSTSDDYSFGELPMPYDLTIVYDPDADPNSMYKVMPSPKRDSISQDILDELDEKMTIDEIVERMKEKARDQVGTQKLEEISKDDEEIKPEDIPF